MDVSGGAPTSVSILHLVYESSVTTHQPRRLTIKPSLVKCLIAVLTCLLVGSACASEDSPSQAVTANAFSDPVRGGGVDFRLGRDDIDCTRQNLSVQAETPVITAHQVVQGNLASLCFGVQDARLINAWQLLASITPEGELHKVGVFSGFVSGQERFITLATVSRPVIGNPAYQISINLDRAEANKDDLLLTLAHEWAHIIGNDESEVDYTLQPHECTTWHDGRGCYREDSLMWKWVQQFWGNGLIELVNTKVDPSPDVGRERCLFFPGFLGNYAASHPREDFAESFAAFVVQVEVHGPELEAKMRWFAEQPELAQFRNRAIEAGNGPRRAHFGRCG